MDSFHAGSLVSRLESSTCHESPGKIEKAKRQAQGMIASIEPSRFKIVSVAVKQNTIEELPRLCAVFKFHVNIKIIAEDYFLNWKQEFTSWNKKKFYLKFQLSPPGFQKLIDDKAQVYVIKTTFGLFELVLQRVKQAL